MREGFKALILSQISQKNIDQNLEYLYEKLFEYY